MIAFSMFKANTRHKTDSKYLLNTQYNAQLNKILVFCSWQVLTCSIILLFCLKATQKKTSGTLISRCFCSAWKYEKPSRFTIPIFHPGHFPQRDYRARAIYLYHTVLFSYQRPRIKFLIFNRGNTSYFRKVTVYSEKPTLQFNEHFYLTEDIFFFNLKCYFKIILNEASQIAEKRREA